MERGFHIQSKGKLRNNSRKIVRLQKLIKVTSAEYLEDCKISIAFQDGHISIVDFKPFLYAKERGYYNRFREIKYFKKFKIEGDNLVWGEDWDMVFPVAELYQGKINL